MTVMARKRFWREAIVAEAAAGWAVHLDAKPLNTPEAAPLRVPNRPLAEGIAAEWSAVESEVRPDAMPLTRIAVAAIDQVLPHPMALVTAIAAYGESDLVCYRAEGPEALRRRQAEAWDPLLDWADLTFGAPLVPVEGVMYRPQPETSATALRAAVAGRDAFRLAGLAELVTLSGSLVLGLAVAEGAIDADSAWRLSRVDEDWQISHWGEDAEAAAAAEHRRREFIAAETFLRLLAT